MVWTTPYNTGSEIRRRSGITGNVNISTASVASKITISDGIVDGYIGDVYTLPLSSTCSVVKELAGEVAEALILKEQYGPEVEDSDKDGYNKWDSVIKILKSIQSGEMKLYTDSTPRTEFTANTETQPKAFGDNTSDALLTSASTAPQMRMGMKF